SSSDGESGDRRIAVGHCGGCRGRQAGDHGEEPCQGRDRNAPGSTGDVCRGELQGQSLKPGKIKNGFFNGLMGPTAATTTAAVLSGRGTRWLNTEMALMDKKA